MNVQILDLKNHNANEIRLGDKLTDYLMHGVIHTVEKNEGELGVYEGCRFIKLSAFLSAFKPAYIIRKVI